MISPTLAFDYPTLDQLTEHVAGNVRGLEIQWVGKGLGLVGGIGGVEPPEADLSPSSGAGLDLEALSNDDLARLLRDRLESVN